MAKDFWKVFNYGWWIIGVLCPAIMIKYESFECSVHFLRRPWLETGKCEIVGLQTVEKIHGYFTPESYDQMFAMKLLEIS